MRRQLTPNVTKDFLSAALGEGRRFDGRSFSEFRKLRVEFGPVRGHVEALLGETRVRSVTTCEIVEPAAERPVEGFLTFHVQFSPIASPEYDPTVAAHEHGKAQQADLRLEIRRILQTSLRESRAIDTESLCILSGRKVWKLRVDVHVLDDCGNIAECAVASAMASLLHFRRPEVSVRGGEVTVHPVEERDPVPLSVHHIAVCASFGVLEGGYIVADPHVQEEPLLQSRMSVAVNGHGELCGMVKFGGLGLDRSDLVTCWDVATKRGKKIIKLLKKRLEEDNSFRESERYQRKWAASSLPSVGEMVLEDVETLSEIKDLKESRAREEGSEGKMIP
eukprot:TRINITY_DN24887_c0_g1_i1.p1 TRINITY_DN24887_c0_g1~~TRINITY_DN24887_c0_g1_i1.p1  ORF type:complete len:335 (+),score=103.44 TRINITY_DN24887_c0_g1_i1:125-1129(+)